MVIIDTFYHLIERETSTISVHWKVLQVLGFISASTSGFVSMIWFYKLLQGFSMNCILYPDIAFKELPPGDLHYNVYPNHTTINGADTLWKSDILCQYSICVWVVSFIGGAIFATFFIVSPKGGKGYLHSPISQPWKMICPMAFLCTLMSVLTGAAVISTADGINAFCASFQNYTNSTICTEKIDVYTLKYNEHIQPFNNSRKIVKACASCAWISWLCCLIVIAIRICLAPDFQLQVMNVKPTKKVFHKQKEIYSQDSPTVLQKHRQLGVEQLPVTSSKSTQKTEDEAEVHYV